ncbi:hypothetical protein niasHT_023241 [Heterodera trifolii]|uniref:t-SNARE coiled-coil homology domain-containing protein n=1 Tax=Heterodera trifolii TaxID=157864 RepID=A0ABD2JDD0_9BILA
MVRDRLNELQKAFPNGRPSPSPIPAPLLNVQSLQSSGDPSLDRITQMRQSVEQIERRIRTMVEVQETILGQTVVRPEEKNQLDTLIDEIRQRSAKLRPKLRHLGRDLETQGTAGDAFRRMRKIHSEQLIRRLNEVLEMFASAQEDYRQRVNRRVRRQLELAGERISADEVTHLLADNSEDIFFRRISPISFAAQSALEDASSRHVELLQLERTIGELNDCFQDMLQLVHSQGVLVDSIESHVQSASDFVGHANVQVNRAVSYKSSAQRLKCVVVLLVVGLLLLLFLLFIFLFVKFFPSVGSH